MFELETADLRTILHFTHHDPDKTDDPVTTLARLIDRLLDQLSPL